jgi:glycosyltransferase involved in cell wall biosynthesis
VTTTARVLHLVPANGGGVDRFVRDLCSLRPGDWLLHVSDEQCVVECPGSNLFLPMSLADLRSLVARGVLGRAWALHAHSTVAAIRETTRLLAAGMQLPWLVTLHDVQFAGLGDSLPAGEVQQRLEFIRAAVRCTVPSNFMRGVALEVLGESFACTVVENGVDGHGGVAAAPVHAGKQFPVAVIGAMGQHKGLAHLLEVASHLPKETPIVLLGYADGQIGPGWLVPDKVWVHGVFEPGQLPQLVGQYGATLAFFPKGQPESYCYALSDAWLAGLPVVGPDWGAIGERIRTSGGGSLYQPEAPAAEVALIIAGQLRQAATRRADVSAAVRCLASVATMVATMNELYAGVGAPEVAADLDGLRLAAGKHLDSRFFRQELLRLQGDLAAAVAQRESALGELRTLADHFDERGRWIDHLQRSCDDWKKSSDELEPMRVDYPRLLSIATRFEALQAEQAALQESHLRLRTAHETLVARLTAPLRLLPAPVRTWLVEATKRVLLSGRRHG